MESVDARFRDFCTFSDNLGHVDFFMGRAEFLPNVYGRIGAEVSGVDLDFDGRLVLFMGDSAIELVATDEDMEHEDSIWQVVMESPAGSDVSLGGTASRVSTGNAVIFVPDVERQC